MSAIELANGDIHIEASLIASDLELDPADVLEAMRSGRLTATCERGVSEDAGRHRVTFFHGNRRLRLVIEAGGEVLERSLAQLHPIRRMPQCPV